MGRSIRLQRVIPKALRALLVVCVVIWPSVSEGEVIFFAAVGSGPGSLVVFSPATSGASIVGEIPFFTVTLASLDDPQLTFFGDGSVVDTGVGGPGFNSIEIVPSSSRVSQINFTIDSFDISAPIDESSPDGHLTLTVTDSFGDVTSRGVAFPYSDSRINQGYGVAIRLADPQFIAALTISYSDPTGSGNTIRNIRNITVNAVPLPVPEPSTLVFWSILVGVVGVRARLKRGTATGERSQLTKRLQ